MMLELGLTQLCHVEGFVDLRWGLCLIMLTVGSSLLLVDKHVVQALSVCGHYNM